MSNQIHIALVEDNPGDSRLIIEYLKDCENQIYQVTEFNTLADFFKGADEFHIDLILLDLSLPDSSGIETIEKTNARFSNIPVVVLTGLDDEEVSIEAMRRGAQDYLVKDQINTVLLNRVLRYAIERKKTAEKLVNSEKKYRKLISNISDVIVIIDENGIVKYKSENITEQFGWIPEDLIGKPAFLTVHPDDANRIQAHFFQLIQKSNSKTRVEYRYRCKNGTYKFVELTAVNLLNDPLIQGVLANYKDISDRKEAEDILKQSEEKYRTMVERSNDMIWTLDIDGCFTFFNEQTEATTGLKLTDWIGKPFWPLILDEERQRIEKIFYRSIIGEPVQYEFTLKKENNDILTLSVNTAPIKKKEQITGIVSFGRDITEQRKLELQIQHSQKMESIGNLAGGIAHDFNNILSPILGMTELMMMDLPPDSQERENAQAIYNAGQRAKELVSQILAFSRQSEHEMMPVRVQKVLREVLKLCRATIPANIELVDQIQQDCGSVWANATQLHQIGMNLITNAYHAVEEKNGKIVVALKEVVIHPDEKKNFAVKPARYLRFSVSDNGVGMTNDVVRKMFDPYFTTKEKGKGTGLGLAVVYGIVHKYGGDIKVISEVGTGSKIHIYLPLMEKKADEESDKLRGKIESGNEHVLLVDDDKAVATLEKQMIERVGYKVTVSFSSMEALNIFKSAAGSFDIVVSDMTMPNMTGDQLARELKKIRPDIPIIICTGYNRKISKENAAQIGIDGLLMKPIGISEIAKMIRNVLDVSKE